MTLKRFAYFFYNFTGFYCFKFENSQFKISRVKFFFNLFRLTSSFLIAAIAMIILSGAKEIIRQDLVSLPVFSDFTRFSLLVGVALQQSSAFVLFFSQALKLSKIASFLNKCQVISPKHEFLEIFEQNVTQHFKVLFFIMIPLTTLKYTAMMIPSAWSFLVFLSFMYPAATILGFFSFVKNFENFIIACLKELESEVEDCFSLISKYKKLYGVSKAFNDAFGNQLTLMTCFVTATIVVGVS